MHDGIIRILIQNAMEARTYAYTPYSGFLVGAALLVDDGLDYSQDLSEEKLRIFKGCNIENAAFTPGICAERTAIAKAVSEGNRQFAAIAIVGGSDKHIADYTAPCGVCRQTLREFVNPDSFLIIMAKSEDDYIVHTLADLLPMSFGPDALEHVK